MELIVRFYQFFKRQDPRGVIGRTLLFLLILAFIFQNQNLIIIKSLFALFSAIFLDLYFIKKEFGHYLFPYSSIVSGLLVVLILDPNAPFWYFILAAIFAVLSKQYIQINKKHIFNPAAFGLFLVSLIFGQKITWWGVSWNYYAPLILLFGAGPILYNLKRTFLPIGFLILYFFFILLQDPAQNPRFIWDGTVFLFTFVMLPEIKTSPILGHFKYTFGLLVGVIFVILSRFLIFPRIDILILPLLLANLVSYIVINRKSFKWL